MLGWIEKRRPRSYMPVGDVGDHEEKSSLRKYHRLFQITLCIGLTLISLGLGYFIRGDSGHLSHREIFANGGFIKNPSNESAALGVSFYHQLHCLHMLQLQYFKTKHELAILRNNSVENTLIDTVGQQNVVHLEHCFDYMVQSILCAADTNLEPPDPILDETNGYGFERSCRDHKGIHNWMERHEYKT
ncbi:hypothetical protein SNOG_12912 [Parastagonospora nodorum SN15]|uniref:Uncharacterized protein n=1 Tax=Phaeosphaeria nodorum (strain SN15 / ATCC MYA-4574 / FGSC 10173) TaxID=321614 RepID=Q0U5Q2_PHANO|nr:hypothetical protein SNOG_12912 [Parastagonospora nodorum SN15]EAT79712.1 hypothetical protein SNOG_12912 [Parastagonospora nodorum SN15]